MPEWQPIETAPKDGTPILIYTGWSPPLEVVVAQYESGLAMPWRGTYGDGDAAFTPTHWMPLPEPPKDNK